MIKDLKEYITQGFLQDVCYYKDESLSSFDISKYDDKNKVYTFYLSPQIFNQYAEPEEHMYGFDYYDKIIERLNRLESLGVIDKYIFSEFIEYNKEDYSKYDPRIFYAYDEVGGEYYIYYDKEKLELFENIVYKTDNLKLNIKKQLFKNILYLLEKEISDWSLDKGPKIFDMDIILDELNINEDKYVFKDMELLLYSISICNDRIYIARLLNYLVNNLNKKDKDLILNSIKSDLNFYYIDFDNGEDYFGESNRDCWIRNAFDGNVGDIGFVKKIKSVSKLNFSLNISYNIKTSILEYNGKKVNFSQAKLQKAFVEKLYDNINNWVSADEINGDGQQILKDMFNKKMKLKTGGEFTSLEFKQLFQTFEDNKKRYFIMIG
ncbi:MAG: hypothetical protein GY828_05685 [Candidatus Gracilibacteria bacterium]|nr:hypothetical protein [Candidatus Gracilibacteria bacterium]